MVKWTEVSAYSGMPVDEDAPTVHTGPAIAGTGDDSSVVVMKKKKKKTLIDARTKTYKEHQRRLQLARERREERKRKAKEKMNEEQLDEFKKVEITLNNPNDVKKIKKDVIDLTNKKRKVNITIKQMGKKLIIDGGDYDITREVSDISNFIGYKSAKVVENVQPKTFTQKVQEQISGFERESFLAENNMNVIKSIVKSKGAKNIKMKDGSLKMDMFTASAITQVYDKVNMDNKKKLEKMVNGTKSQFLAVQNKVMKMIGK